MNNTLSNSIVTIADRLTELSQVRRNTPLSKMFAALLSAVALLSPASSDSQTIWFKYVGNPVMDGGLAGTWDAATVLPGPVIKDDSVYRMWYTGGSGNSFSGWRTGHAISQDGVHWLKTPTSFVLGEGPDAWDGIASALVDVIRTGSDYHMWYTGISSSLMYGVGYATSPDGLVWTKARNANPVKGPGSWYARGPNAPSVVRADNVGGYKAWFQGEGMAHADFQIGYAYATDAITWWTIQESPVLPFGSPGAWDDDKVMMPSVLYDGEIYEMFYAGERSDGHTAIGYATSSDGITWSKFGGNPVLQRGPAAWDLQDIAGVRALFEGNLYYLWYGGTSVFGSFTGWHVGCAVSPKGTNVTVSPDRSWLDRNADTVRVLVRVADPAGLSFSVEFESPADVPVDTLRLFDDGAHGDSLAVDGLFANSWIPGDRNYYSLDLILTLQDTLAFELANIRAYSPVVLVEGQEKSIPFEFTLDQNYPNPFNPSTTIRFGLPQKSTVQLSLFNTLGQQVAVLQEGEEDAGYHEVEFSARDLASGVYIYRLKAGDFVQARRLVVVK